jgi:hypothetical protein
MTSPKISEYTSSVWGVFRLRRERAVELGIKTA